MQPNIQHAPSVYSLAIRLDRSCKFGRYDWPAAAAVASSVEHGRSPAAEEYKMFLFCRLSVFLCVFVFFMVAPHFNHCL